MNFEERRKDISSSVAVGAIAWIAAGFLIGFGTTLTESEPRRIVSLLMLLAAFALWLWGKSSLQDGHRGLLSLTRSADEEIARLEREIYYLRADGAAKD